MNKLSFCLALAATALLATQSALALDVSFERDSSLPIVQINVALKTGAVSDPDQALGLTNFMGEMLLRGTRNKTREQIDLAIDQMGAQLGVETRSESLIVRGAVLSSQLDGFLSLLQELITQPNFPQKEIDQFKSIVDSQILDEEGSDQTLVGLKFTEFLFGNHPYGKPILGKTKTVDAFTRDEIVEQYKKLVTRNLLLVVGSGDAPESKINTWAENLAKILPEGDPDIGKVSAPEMPKQERLLLVDKPHRTQTQITGGQIGVTMKDSRFFPLYLGNHAFGGGSFSARMMREIRVKHGWSYGAYSYFRQSREPRSWQFYLFPAEKDTPAALELTLHMVKDVQENGIKPDEFDFAQRSLVNSAGFMYNTSRKRVENRLMEKTLDLPDGFMKSYGPRLQAVTLKEVNSALKAFLHPDRLQIVVLGTAKDLKAKVAKAAGLSEDNVQVEPYNQE